MKKIILAMMFMLYADVLFASSPLNISVMPNTALPTSLSQGQTATAYYLVQNISTSPQKGNYIKYLPPNVTLDTSGAHIAVSCGANFYLHVQDKQYPEADHCILKLSVTGPVNANDPDVTHHITICNEESDCSGVANKKDELNVTEGNGNSLARIAIGNFDSSTQQGITEIKYLAYTSNDGGIDWTPNVITGASGYIRAIACSDINNQYCTAIGDYYDPNFPDRRNTSTVLFSYTTTDGGISWTSHFIERYGPVSGLSGITCSGAEGQYCLAVGRVTSLGVLKLIAYTSVDGGVNWVPHYPEQQDGSVSSLGALRAVSCSGKNAQYCTAIGEALPSDPVTKRNTTVFFSYTSTDGGINWSSPTIIGKHEVFSDYSHLNGITCNGDNGQYCIAVGYVGRNGKTPAQPIIYKSSNGGISWTSYVPQQGIGGTLSSVTCKGNDGQYCTAVGSINYKDSIGTIMTSPIIYTSLNGGIKWIPHDEFRRYGTGSFDSVVCSTNGQYCTAVGTESYGLNRVIPIIFWSMDSGFNWVTRSRAFAENSEQPQLSTARPMLSMSGGGVE